MSKVTPRDWDSHAAYISPEYKSSILRGVSKSLVEIDPELSELTGPAYGAEVIGELDHDLTKNGQVNGEPIGERIVVTGRVLDENGNPVANTLVEVWQANAGGRYIHKQDQHDAPLDPNFLGSGRCLTDAEGRYKFYTIKPGAYPWGNHANAWRPNHIHFSLFGGSIASRLVTQMYFPGDPLLDLDPIYQSVPAGARERMISEFSIDVTEEGFALGYIFDIVLRGVSATPMEA
ncbi:protocatechuate 3,4-dioxygenase subunit beta [Neptunomonas sp. CHC150]|jgi:protocatechuate 3,4-dioxygenase beta subunit|uniref:protocatechuate 3,4-dioxygenase subunit beta n=1 Tax=Neptunomonas TaxID=75687 RepID=UPI0009488A71|nr:MULTISPECIES: protocatechuate 3,4-dioxygenase subunit beta [Neptunomonas]MBT3146572.1 protocatechuate 3,4-dioxygenase subunit beta [Neptunomonas phycophila]MDN2658843.1 protocatechuate 3,4-dioxygenase subunit beta [Neptunomonas sp. CHC150]